MKNTIKTLLSLTPILLLNGCITPPKVEPSDRWAYDSEGFPVPLKQGNSGVIYGVEENTHCEHYDTTKGTTTCSCGH